MLEIMIYKSQGGRSLVKQFSNSYLFNGAPNYYSDAANQLATKLVEAESRIYFDTTHFMRVVIRQLDPDGYSVYGESRSIPMESTGQTAVPVGSVIMSPNHTVAYQKNVTVGRPGISLYRNAITSDEYNTWVETGAVPQRLNTSYAPGVLPAMFFSAALMAADNDSGLQMILPINSRYAQGAARPVSGILFAGIRERQETYRRESGTENLLEAVQQLVNENGASLRRLMRQIGEATGALRVGLINTIISLVVDAFAKYALLAIGKRALVRFPAIYFATELLALLPAGTIPALT
jgi:hypothetical protein